MNDLPPIEEQIRVIKAALEASKQSIALIGLMGAGKSKLGQELAKALDLDFADSDAVFEEKHNITIREFFDTHGERQFRPLERETIAELMQGEPMVLATGGGAFANDQTRANIKQQGLSLWLDLSPEKTIKRLGPEGIAKRPLLANAPEGPLAKLKELYAARSSAYGQADVRVKLSDEGTLGKEESIAQNRNRVINALYMHLKP